MSTPRQEHAGKLQNAEEARVAEVRVNEKGSIGDEVREGEGKYGLQILQAS